VPSDFDIPIVSAGFLGVNLLDDSASLSPQFVASCENWVPDEPPVLSKRRGSVAFDTVASALQLDAMAHAVKTDGTRYLYAVRHLGGGDDVVVSIDDAAFVGVGSTTIGAASQPSGIVQIGQAVYVGRPAHNLYRIPLGSSGSTLGPLASASDAGQSVATATEASSGILPGQYSYRWALYDHGAAAAYTGIGAVRTVTVSSATWQRLDFQAPSSGASGTLRWHLFVSPVDTPIEGAHDQFPGGVANSAAVTLLAVTADGPFVPIPSSVQRRGHMLVEHQGALVGAGDSGDPQGVWSSALGLESREEVYYNQGIFFPAFFRLQMPAPVTGLGVVASTTGLLTPDSPLAIFTETSTRLMFGTFAAPRVVEASGRIGCISHRSIAKTPIGLLVLGHDSVYLIRPDSQEPIDVGWPISPAVKNIPRSRASSCWGVYHKGFYKLGLVEPGGLTVGQEFWLDLRRGGLGGEVPRWSGPHRRVGLSLRALAVAPGHPSEYDRAWASVDGGGAVVLLDQPGSYRDNETPVTSRLRTGRLEARSVFDRKVFQRVRGMGKTSSPTDIAVTVNADGKGASAGSLAFVAPEGGTIGHGDTSVPPVTLVEGSKWNGPFFKSVRFVEGEYISPSERLHGQSFVVDMVHAGPVEFSLRDLEVRLRDVGRKVA